MARGGAKKWQYGGEIMLYLYSFLCNILNQKESYDKVIVAA